MCHAFFVSLAGNQRLGCKTTNVPLWFVVSFYSPPFHAVITGVVDRAISFEILLRRFPRNNHGVSICQSP